MRAGRLGRRLAREISALLYLVDECWRAGRRRSFVIACRILGGLMRVTRLRASGAGAILIAAAVAVSGQQPKIGYDDTPMQPNGKWHVHDGTRPQPKMVTPGATPGAAPADATILLGTDASAWQMTNGAAVTWPMKDGVLQSGKGMIETKAQFTDFQLHVEFA